MNLLYKLKYESEKNLGEAEVKGVGAIFQPLTRDENNFYGFGFSDPDGHKFNILLMEEGM